MMTDIQGFIQKALIEALNVTKCYLIQPYEQLLEKIETVDVYQATLNSSTSLVLISYSFHCEHLNIPVTFDAFSYKKGLIRMREMVLH